MSPPQRGHWKEVSSTPAVAAQAGWMQRWKTRSAIWRKDTAWAGRREPPRRRGRQASAKRVLHLLAAPAALRPCIDHRPRPRMAPPITTRTRRSAMRQRLGLLALTLAIVAVGCGKDRP